MLASKEFEIELQEIAKKIKKEDSENITFLKVIEAEYRENIITTFLKFIIDPNQNGVGWLPLNKLLETVDITHDFTDEDLENIEIIQEYGIENKRRIDLVIKTKQLWIVIENKINAWQQINQTKDYFNYIQKEKEYEVCTPKVEYIYLKPNYNRSEPDKETKFQSLMYSKLIEYFEQIAEEDYLEKEKYKFLKEFIKHCRGYFMQETQVDYNNEYVKFYLENETTINNISKRYFSESENLYRVFQERLKEGLNKDEKDMQNSFCIQPNPQRKWLQIIQESWKELHWGVHYELFTNNDFYKLLGKKDVEIIFTLHIEGWVYNKYRDIFKAEGIEHKKGEFTKKYNFTTNEEFEKNMEDIIKEIKKMDEERGEKVKRAIEIIRKIKESDEVE